MPRIALALAVLVLTPLALDAQKTERKLGDFTITHEVPVLDVCNQGRAGTCWSFATVSFLESETARTTGKPVDLSEIWPVRQVYLEKTREYLKRKGQNTYSEGGLSHDLSMVMEKYGLMPASAYPGLPSGQRRHDHSELSAVLTAAAKTFTKKGRVSPHWEKVILGICDAYLGDVPQEFTVEGKTYDAKTYMKDVLKLEPGNYLEVMSYGKSEFDKPAKLNVPDNWMHHDQYLNMPIDQAMAGMIHALENGYSIALDADVSEPGFNPMAGIAVLPDALEKPGAVTQKIRDEMFDKKETTDDHLMHVVGLAKGPKGGRWFLTKNSWGKMGKYRGYLFLSENYVRAKTLAFMVNRNGLPTAQN